MQRKEPPKRTSGYQREYSNNGIEAEKLIISQFTSTSLSQQVKG